MHLPTQQSFLLGNNHILIRAWIQNCHHHPHRHIRVLLDFESPHKQQQNDLDLQHGELFPNTGSRPTRESQITPVGDGGRLPAQRVELFRVREDRGVVHDGLYADAEVGAFGELELSNFDVRLAVTGEDVDGWWVESGDFFYEISEL